MTAGDDNTGAGETIVSREPVFEILAGLAQAHSLIAYAAGVNTIVMCAVCYQPPQLAKLLDPNGVLRPWNEVLKPRWSLGNWPGSTRIKTTGNRHAGLVELSDLLDELYAVECQDHDPAAQGFPLNNWDWRSELSRALLDHPDAAQWATTWAAQQAEKEERLAQEELEQKISEAAELLTHRERVRALFTVLHEQNSRVTQADAVVSWECLHDTTGGKFAAVHWNVSEDGMPGLVYDHGGCRQDHRNHRDFPQVDLYDLLDEYDRVEDLLPDERAKYAAPRRRARSGAGAKSAEPARVSGDVETVAGWLDTAGVPPALAQRKAWELARAIEPHPTQDAVIAAQKWRQQQARL